MTYCTHILCILPFQIHMWDSGTGQLKQRLHAGGAVVDMCSISANQQLYLAALTEKHLRVLKWS